MAWTRVDAGKNGVSSIALTVAIALPFIGLSIEAQAQTVTIDTAVVVPTTVNAGETLIVEDSGSITGGTDGVRAETRIASLTNSGRITGGVHAILEEGSVGSSDTVLTLLDGSLIIGAIDLGGGTNTLILGSGSSQALTIEQLDSVSATGGNPFAARVDGVNTLVAVVDPTSVGLRDEGLADLTRGNFGVLGSRQSRVRSGFSGGVGMQLGYAPTQGERAAFDAAMVNERPARAIWGECSAATACRMDRAISLIRQAVLSATLWARTLPIRIR